MPKAASAGSAGRLPSSPATRTGEHNQPAGTGNLLSGQDAACSSYSSACSRWSARPPGKIEMMSLSSGCLPSTCLVPSAAWGQLSLHVCREFRRRVHDRCCPARQTKIYLEQNIAAWLSRPVWGSVHTALTSLRLAAVSQQLVCSNRKSRGGVGIPEQCRHAV